jgi:Holliday junction DNA helicase RuvA
MIEYVRGKLAAVTPTKVVVDVGGVGYGVFIPLSAHGRLPQIGEEIFLHLCQVIREDAHLLFGFLTEEEKDFFGRLTAISGIGPKTALALLGHLDLADLRAAIFGENSALLSKVPGIGKKTAERIVIELRDKVQAFSPGSKGNTLPRGAAVDAIQALVHLGYTPLAAQNAVKKVVAEKGEAIGLGPLITASLRSI